MSCLIFNFFFHFQTLHSLTRHRVRLFPVCGFWVSSVDMIWHFSHMWKMPAAPHRCGNDTSPPMCCKSNPCGPHWVGFFSFVFLYFNLLLPSLVVFRWGVVGQSRRNYHPWFVGSEHGVGGDLDFLQSSQEQEKSAEHVDSLWYGLLWLWNLFFFFFKSLKEFKVVVFEGLFHLWLCFF